MSNNGHSGESVWWRCEICGDQRRVVDIDSEFEPYKMTLECGHKLTKVTAVERKFMDNSAGKWN